MSGTLSPSIGKLLALQTLDLSGNKLTGESESGDALGASPFAPFPPLPLFLSSWHNSEVRGRVLSLTPICSFACAPRWPGAIPSELGDLVSLKSLDLHHTGLYGERTTASKPRSLVLYFAACNGSIALLWKPPIHLVENQTQRSRGS